MIAPFTLESAQDDSSFFEETVRQALCRVPADADGKDCGATVEPSRGAPFEARVRVDSIACSLEQRAVMGEPAGVGRDAARPG